MSATTADPFAALPYGRPPTLTDLDLERACAARTLRSGFAYAREHGLVAEHYTSPTLAQIHELAEELHELGKEVTPANIVALAHQRSPRRAIAIQRDIDDVMYAEEAYADPERLRELAALRPAHSKLLWAAVALEDGNPERAMSAVTAAMQAVDEAKRSTARPEQTHPITAAWRALDLDAFTTPPPPREWLFMRDDDETNGMGAPVGVLPIGKTGLLVSEGGAGKTLLLVQAALSVATGRKWLDRFHVPHPGNVLLVLGEEDEQEARRRFYFTARAMRLTDDQLRIATERVVVLPLAGVDVSLVAAHDGMPVETPALEALRAKASEREWKLIALDPLSRFAGADTEKDNREATRFVQVAESLTKLPGSPTVLIAHHTNKTSRNDGSSASAAHARGASGLIDGARWVANLERIGDDAARLTITKSNYAPHGRPVELVRDLDHGGHLRVMTPDEERRRAEARQEADERQRTEELCAVEARILEMLGANPGLSKSGLREEGLKVRTAVIGTAVDALVARGLVRKSSTHRYGFEVVTSTTEVVDGP